MYDIVVRTGKGRLWWRQRFGRVKRIRKEEEVRSVGCIIYYEWQFRRNRGRMIDGGGLECFEWRTVS